MVVGTDTISDMLTRIRNANQMKYKTVDIPATKITTVIADILTKEGYTLGHSIKKTVTGDMIVLNLKYGPKKERVITNLKRISKPGLRVYAPANEIPKVLNGLGIALVSTSSGLMTDKDARKENVGGEIIAYIW